MAANRSVQAIDTVKQSLSLRTVATIADDAVTLRQIREILKKPPQDDQRIRLDVLKVPYDHKTVDLSQPEIRQSLNLFHLPVFEKESLEELRTALGLPADVVVNEFNESIRKAMHLPFFGPRLIVAQYFAKYRVFENEAFSSDRADKGKDILESKDSPLSAYHVNELLTRVVKAFAPANEIPHILPCKYELRDSFFAVIADIIERGSEQQLAALDTALVRALVDVYYTASRPIVYDLFSHMAANELMLIDIDSLLLQCFSNVNVDWDLMQSLHVAHLVNKFIVDFKNRGAKIHIVSFDCHDWFWNKVPQKRLIRNAVKGLLKQRATQPNPPFAYFEFENYFEDAFSQDYIKAYNPEFIILNDGEEMHPVIVDGVAQTNEGKFRSVVGDDDLGAQAASALHRMMIYFVATRLHVVYSSRQIHKDNNIFGFTIRSSSASFVPFEPLVAFVAAHVAADSKQFAAAPQLDAIDDTVFENLNGYNNNALVAVAAAAKFLFENGADAATTAVIKAMIVTTCVQPYLAIDTRFQSVDSSNPAAAPFVAAVSAVSSLMADVWGSLSNRPRYRAKDYDVIDGHLVASIAALIAKQPVKDLVSDDVCEMINDVWANVCGEEGATITDDVVVDAPTVPRLAVAAPGVFTGYKHDMIDKLATSFGVAPMLSTTTTLLPEEKFITLALAKFKNWTANHSFVEYNDVISKKELEKKRLEDEEKCRRNHRFKAKLVAVESRFYKAIDEIATSMKVPESKVTTGKKITDDNDDDNAEEGGKDKHAADKKKYSGPSSKKDVTGKGEVIQENNATSTATRVQHAITAVNNRLQLLDKRAALYDPVGADQGPNFDSLSASFDDLTHFANTTLEELVNEREERVKNGKGAAGYADLFKLAYTKHAGASDVFTFITSFSKTSGSDAKRYMENIAKNYARDAEQLAKLLAKKKPTDADKKSIEELESTILVNEPNPARCGYYAVRAYAAMAQRYLRFMILVRILMVRLKIWNTVKLKWVSECKVLDSKEAMQQWLDGQSWQPAVELWLAAHKLLANLEKEPLPIKDMAKVDYIRAAIINLDMEIYCDKSFDPLLKTRLGVDSLGALPSHLRPSCTLPVPVTATNFQLCRMGDRLERPQPHHPDPRVVFNADEWQRDLMNIVDRRGSVIVSAPTSSGKTFISYYCMEQVFGQQINAQTREEDIGVVVYVAPTRALINQAAADIYGRYKKTYQAGRAIQIFGILGGRDYVRHPFDCQALVTLPDVLETILLSPLHQKWLKRVKYFIFDEIHTMEDSGNGAVWERLLSLIRAPYVALSATIGDTNNLLAWLNRVQKRQEQQYADPSRTFDVSLIPKNGTTIARWSDIEKHVFIPTTDLPLRSLHRSDIEVDRNDVIPFHPLSVASFEILERKEAFPSDLGIVPRETVELVEQMIVNFNEVYKFYTDVPIVTGIAARILGFRQDNYFKDLLTIDQTKARGWEAAAKKEILLWVKLGSVAGIEELQVDTVDMTEEEIEEFAGRMRECVTSILSNFSTKALERENTLLAKARAGEMSYPDTTEFIHAGIMRCLHTLNARNMNPAIIFVLDQEECERLVETVVVALEQAEQAFRATPAFIRYENEMALGRERNNRLKATQASMRFQQEDEGGRNEGDRSVRDVGAIRPDSDFDIPNILNEFTFAPMVASDDDIATALKDNEDLEKSILYRALQRGIGMHHNGISGKLRGSVERAFRKKLLPFVFSTEGLALGIHSPCRTVVLAGDNVALNVSEFRQMAGRAGRRGLDFLGHVVFFGVSFKKIKRLMTGDMANLRGHSQMDPATALRLMELYNTPIEMKPGHPTMAEWHDTVKNIAELGYVDPLFVRGRSESRSYADDHIALVRHLVTYFARCGLLNLAHKGAEGKTSVACSTPGNLLVTMLNIRNNVRLETSSFAFLEMLLSNVISAVTVIDPNDPKSPDPSSEEYNRRRCHNAALAISYVLSNHYKFHIPLEVHRSITRDAMAHALRAQKTTHAHIVYLPNPSGPVKASMDLQSGRMLKVLSNYVIDRAQFIEQDVSLPFGLVNKNNAIVTSVALTTDTMVEDLAEKLLATANRDVKARHPLIAISGKNDNFDSVEDLIHSLASGLFLDLSDVAAIDMRDLGRHDGSPVLINACFYDYVRNGSQQRGQDHVRLNLMLFNNLTQSASWGTLSTIFNAIDALRIALDEVAGDDLATHPTCTAIDILADRLKELREQLDNRAKRRDWRTGAAVLNV